MRNTGENEKNRREREKRENEPQEERKRDGSGCEAIEGIGARKGAITKPILTADTTLTINNNNYNI